MVTNPQPPSGKITLVFTDVQDSLRMNKALGDTAYGSLLREPHDARIRKAIAQFHSYEVKSTGDGFMLAFDRADNALAFAVSIQEALTAPPITTTDATGAQWMLGIRVGIHTAEHELFPDEQGDYHGEDVNFAARVASLGTSGQIIVSHSTFVDGNREHHRWREWPDRRIKSFDEPEAVWELLWDGESRGEPGSRWLPEWFMGERNRYVPRPSIQDEILTTFATPQADGSTPRLVTLHGFGGMGKTRLAVACATQAAGRFEDGIFFVRLDAGVPSRDCIIKSIAEGLSLDPTTICAETLLAVLRDKEVLLILDNYESVDCNDVALYLTELLTLTRRVHFLVAGREVVKLSDVEQWINLDDGVTPDEARQLFTARVQLKRGQHWQPSEDELDAINTILDLTQGIPLAIELAAAWADKRALAEIASGLEAMPLGLMSSEPRRSLRTDRVERHTSLTHCLDWSYNLLEAAVQEGFAFLGLFPTTFTAEAFVSVSASVDAQDLLDRFQDAALIRRVEAHGHSRYTMNRFTRAYAAEKLAAQDPERMAHQRFVAYYRKMGAENGGAIHTLTREKFATLDAEWRNAITATHVAEQLESWDSILTLSRDLSAFLLSRERWAELEALSQLALKAANLSSIWDKPDSLGILSAERDALHSLGQVYEAQGRSVKAEEWYKQVLTLCREIGDRRGEEQALCNLGMVYQAMGRWADAGVCHKKSLAICREVGLSTGDDDSLITAGNLDGGQDRWVKTEAWYQQGLAICREADDRVGEGHMLATLAVLKAAQGELHAAVSLGRQAINVLEVTDNAGTLEETQRLLAKWQEQVA